MTALFIGDIDSGLSQNLDLFHTSGLFNQRKMWVLL